MRAAAVATIALFYAGLFGVASHKAFHLATSSSQAVGAGTDTASGLGQSVGGEERVGDAPAADGTSAVGSGASGTGATAGPGSSATSPAGSRSTSGSGAASTARTGTGAQITIGIQYNDPSSDGAYTVLGVKGTTTGDDKGAYDALIADVNSRGGLGGRKVVPIYYANNNTDGSFDSQGQAACASFTEDHKVDLAIVTGTATRLLPGCLAAHHVPTLPVGNIMFDDTVLAGWAPYVYWSGMLSPDRWAPWIDLLSSNGYFGQASKVGLVTYETPLHHRVVERVVGPALARAGHQAADVAYTTEPPSVSALGSSATELSNVILRFRSENIDHVMFVGTQGAAPFLWMPQAESQGYRPRYGFTSADFPYVVQANAATAQLRDAIGMGWTPVRDVNFSQDPGGNPAAARCEAIMAKAGNKTPDRSADWQSHIAPCEAMFFFEAVFARATGTSGAAFRAAVDQLGTSYQSPHTFATRFVHDHYDGVSQVRAFRYDTGCSCFGYVGPLIAVP